MAENAETAEWLRSREWSLPVTVTDNTGMLPAVVQFGAAGSGVAVPAQAETKGGQVTANKKSRYVDWGWHTSLLVAANMQKLIDDGVKMGIADEADRAVLKAAMKQSGHKKGDEVVRHVERYRRKMAANGGVVGMMISAAGLALQRIKVTLRGALCLGDLDVDMVNAHPAGLASVFGDKVPTLVEYVRNRKTWLEALEEMHPDTSRATRKDLFRAAINRRRPEDMYHRWCHDDADVTPCPKSYLGSDGENPKRAWVEDFRKDGQGADRTTPLGQRVVAAVG